MMLNSDLQIDDQAEKVLTAIRKASGCGAVLSTYLLNEDLLQVGSKRSTPGFTDAWKEDQMRKERCNIYLPELRVYN